MWQLGLVGCVLAQTSILNYRLYEVLTQVNYDYSLNNCHGLMGTTTAVEPGVDPTLTTMGATFAAGNRLTTSPNTFSSVEIALSLQFSLLFWLYPTSLASTTLIERYDSVAALPILNVGLKTGGVYVTINGSLYTTTAFGIVTGAWQMVTIVLDCSSTCAIKAYRNLGETSASLSTGATFSDNPAIPFTLGYSKVSGASGFLGKLNEIEISQGLLLLSDLNKSLAYTSTGNCPSCSTICGYRLNDNPSYRCLTSTSTALTNVCASNCGSTGIQACTHYMQDLCFTIGNGCDSTCYTCLNGLTLGNCDTCYDITMNWNSANGYWGQCECQSNQYWDLTTHLCHSCFASCASCTDGGVSSCTSCIANTSLLGTSPSSCLCSAGWYLNIPTTSCQLCDVTCATCNNAGPTMCLSCFTNASLVSSPGPAACVCNAGWNPSPSASNCIACAPSCAQCSGSGLAQCLSCYANAGLSGAAPATCVCNVHYFPNPTAASCAVCATSCWTCSGASAGKCVSCYANAVLSSFTCTCATGYFSSPDASNCVACHQVCQACSGSSTFCLSCAFSGSVPVCSCGSGKYSGATTCQNCDSTCGECSVGGPTGCTQCLAGAALTGSAPSSCTCNAGSYPNPTSAICAACAPSCAQCSGSGLAQCLSCYANASLAAGPPNFCNCQPRYFPNTTSANCSACNISCLMCSGSSSSQCITCHVNASLSGTAPSSCACDLGFSPSPTTANCVICDPTCAQCSAIGSSGCTQCHSNAVLGSTAPSSCTCKAGFFSSTASANCAPCDPICFTCTGSSPSMCSSCYSNATLISGFCQCNLISFPNPTAQNCSACDSSCAQCSAAGALSCTLCQENAILNGSPPTNCICQSGFALTNAKCQLSCDSTCATCSDSGACLTCFANAYIPLSSNLCACQDGYYPSSDASTCLPCSFLCLVCTNNTNCLQCHSHAIVSPQSLCQCAPNYFPSPDASSCQSCPQGCLLCTDLSTCQSCREEYYLTTTGACLVCPDCAQPLVAYATGPIQSDYNITFSRPVKRLFLASDFNLASVPNTSISWTIPYDLTLRVSGGPWGHVTALLIQFLPNVTDIYNLPLSTKQLSVPPPLDPQVYPTTLNATIATVCRGSAAIVTSSAAILGTSVGGGSAAMALLSQMQYFSYIIMANYSITDTTSSFYANLNQQSALPNIFQRAGLGRRLDAEDFLGGRDFLDSSGHYFTLLVGIVTLHIALFLLTRVVKWRALQRLEALFEWTIYLYYWYFAFLDLQISAILQVKDGDKEDSRYVVCTVLAITVLILTSLTPLCVYFFISHYRLQLLSTVASPLKREFGSLVLGLRSDVKWAKYLVPMYYVQRVIYGLLIVFMRERPIYQSLFLIVPCGLMTLFTVIARPMFVRASRLLQIVGEIDAFLVYVLLCFATLQYSVPRVSLCWLVVGLTLKSFLCMVLIVVFQAAEGVRTCCKRYLKKEHEAKRIAKVFDSSCVPEGHTDVLDCTEA